MHLHLISPHQLCSYKALGRWVGTSNVSISISVAIIYKAVLYGKYQPGFCHSCNKNTCQSTTATSQFSFSVVQTMKIRSIRSTFSPNDRVTSTFNGTWAEPGRAWPALSAGRKRPAAFAGSHCLGRARA